MEWRAFSPLGGAERPAYRCYGIAFPLRPQNRAAGLQVLHSPTETGRALFPSAPGKRALLHRFS